MERTKSHESQYASSLIEASLDPLVVISVKGKILDINEAFLKLTGLSRDSLINTNFASYFTEPDLAKAIYHLVFEKQMLTDYPLTIKHINGKLTEVLYNVTLYKDGKGEVEGMLAVARNITQLKWVHELIIANKELDVQKTEKEKRANELIIANEELAFQNEEKEKRANELIIANEELAFQNEEKEKRANELIIANEELAFQNLEKESRADELLIANKELAFQNLEKENRADELIIANKELALQNLEKESRAVANNELEAFSISLQLDSQYTRSLIEASIDPLVVISPEGKIMDSNEATLDVTHKTREAITGTDFKNYFTDPQKAREVYLQVFETGFVKDYPLTMKDGKLTDVLFNGAVYKDPKGNVLGAVIVARDVMQQKKNEKDLIEARIFAELATEIAEEAKEKAEVAALLAEEAVKAKQQFLSNMSHEIRTPMNAIIGFTKVMLKTGLSDKQKEYLSAIKMSGDALIVLINDILDLSKVDAGKMVFEQSPFRMAASISSMLHLFDTKIQEKNLILIKKYDNKIPAILLGDPVRLHQIILNLVSNAVKFTNIGIINVSVKMLSEDDTNVVIEFAVTDTGIGIVADKLESIFENFQQASSSTARQYGGTGLGLAIVKQLVEKQGGTIQVMSKIGIGSTFSFTLTFQKTNEEIIIEESTMETEMEIKHIKVLVVEDIALNQLLMKTLLDDFGFEREIVENGKIAIEKLAKNSYDIILMDLQMPEMNGFEATEYIRNTLHSKIPIIALTADVTTSDLEKCKAVGMNDYIAKPVDERLLYSKIMGLVKKNTPIVEETEDFTLTEPIKYTDLAYLMQRTKNNPTILSELISAYLEQTPSLINTMKQSLQDKDWESLQAAAHKMIPSFSIVGMHGNFEIMAKKVQEYAHSKAGQDEVIHSWVSQLEKACVEACKELTAELNRINNTNI